MPASNRTNQRGKATESCIRSVKKDDSRYEKDPQPPLVTPCERISSDLDLEEVVSGEAAPDHTYLPPGWAHIKLEPDW